MEIGKEVKHLIEIKFELNLQDFLISLKKLAVKRAIAIGHVQPANKFDLKVLQAPGIFPITFVLTC